MEMEKLVSFLKKTIVVHTIFFYLFITSGLIVNFCQLLSLILWPLSRPLYRKVNRFLAYCLWSIFTWLAQHWSKTKCQIYMNNEDFKKVGKENAIVIMNHKYDVDWLVGWIVCQNTHMLAGSKIIGKSPLRYIPIIGWCWYFSESIFIQRKWDLDKKTLTEDLNVILEDYPKGYYYNVLLFCEGTRFTKKKHEESMKIAREKGLPELEHHLLPRTKGFSLLARGIADKVDAVYDLTIGIKETKDTKAAFNTIRLGKALESELLVRRIPMSDVPSDEAKSAEFINKLYQEKDKIFDCYAKTGSFESYGVEKCHVDTNYWDLYITLFFMVVTLPPLFYFLYLFYLSCSTYAVLSIFLLFFIVKLFIKLFESVTKSNIGSTYGLKHDKAAKND